MMFYTQIMHIIKYMQIYMHTTIYMHVFSIAIYRINERYYLVSSLKSTQPLNHFCGNKYLIRK